MTTTATAAPLTKPVAIGPDTFLIPNLAPAGDAYVPVSSIVPVTSDVERVGERLGVLAGTDLADLDEALRIHLAL